MTRFWSENEDALDRFREWLSETADDIEALDASDFDAVDREFADEHLSELNGEDRGGEENDAAPREVPTIGLLQLVESFTAMRHELKLQTKGTRGLEASVEKSLAGLDAASRDFHATQANEREAAERASLPLIETLIGLDEGMLRAAQAFHATHRQLTRSAPDRLRAQLDAQFAKQSWWGRLLGRRWHTVAREATCEALVKSIAEEFSDLMEGFQFIQSRLERTLQDHGVTRVDVTGVRVDPNRMTVVELVTDSDAPPETVVEVVRSGYQWGDRVVRFAEVRAVASRAAQRNNVATFHDGNSLDAAKHPTSTAGDRLSGGLPDDDLENGDTRQNELHQHDDCRDDRDGDAEVTRVSDSPSSSGKII